MSHSRRGWSARRRSGRAGRPRRVVIEARAKLNLGLAVGPRRRDGFHELATIFQSVSLADTLIAERSTRGFSLSVRHENASVRGRAAAESLTRVPAGGQNLVLKGARLAAHRWGIAGGARFVLVKRIPPESGLGGGSADAAAAIAAMLALYRLNVPRAERLALAAELGSDVPFALTGGSALGLGRGEKLTRVRFARPFRALIAVPDWRVSTARAYRMIDRSKYILTAWGPKLRFAKALGRERVSAERTLRLGNVFEEVLGERRPNFLSLRARLRAAGLVEPLMTGSGSAVFGILPRGMLAKTIVGRFAGRESLYLVRTARAGLRLEARL